MCTECGETFVYRTCLREHKKRHSDVREYACETCGKAFKVTVTTRKLLSLPPAYVVRREGNVLTRVCLSVHRGGVSPARGGRSVQPWGGGPVQAGRGVGQSSQGGGPAGEGGQSSWGGGSAKIGQHREYLLHGGRYASCVHAGGLSCFAVFFTQPRRPANCLDST